MLIWPFIIMPLICSIWHTLGGYRQGPLCMAFFPWSFWAGVAFCPISIWVRSHLTLGSHFHSGLYRLVPSCWATPAPPCCRRHGLSCRRSKKRWGGHQGRTLRIAPNSCDRRWTRRTSCDPRSTAWYSCRPRQSRGTVHPLDWNPRTCVMYTPITGWAEFPSHYKIWLIDLTGAACAWK